MQERRRDRAGVFVSGLLFFGLWFRGRFAATDRSIVLLDLLLIRRGDVAGTLQKHACRITAERATETEFKVFESLDGLRTQVRGGSDVLERGRVHHLSEAVDRTIEVLRRYALISELFAKRFGIGESLLRLTAELLRVLGGQSSSIE